MSPRSDPLHGSETEGRFSPVSPHSLPGGCPQPPPRHAPHLKRRPLAGSPGLLRSPHRESRLVNGFQICWRTSWCFVGVRCIVFVVHVVGGAVVLASTAFSVQPVSFSFSSSFVVHAKREGSQSHCRNVQGALLGQPPSHFHNVIERRMSLCSVDYIYAMFVLDSTFFIRFVGYLCC